MIKKLRHRVLITIMFFVTAILLAFILAITVIPTQRDRREVQSFLEQITDMSMAAVKGRPDESMPGGVPPRDSWPTSQPQPGNDANMFASSNMVTAELDSDGGILSWFSDRQDLYDEEYIESAAQKIINKTERFGSYDGQYYMLRETDNGYVLAMLDNSVGFENLRRTIIISSAAGVAAWIALLLVSILLVNKMTKPVSTAFEKQRQFISDAGHELKTPISVVAANANVLQTEIGENKWLSYINEETKRMELLVYDLMTLAEVDDEGRSAPHSSFDMSKAVLASALPFESLAFERGMAIQFEVHPDVCCHGSEEQIKQLVTILMSNAVKYGNERGAIRVSLAQQRKKAVLRVYNSGDGIAPEERDKIFDRFYRVDKSRSRENGSYGLGLAIAKSIVDEHDGHIAVDSELGSWVQFSVTLSEK